MNARDAALLRRWSEHRDAEAFNDLVSHYADMVYATCKRTLGNPSDAEELTQECFLKLASGPVRIRTSLGGYLHSAATSLSINRLRSDARRRKREGIAVAKAPSSIEPTWDDIQRHVDEAIADLPEELREPLIRHFLQRETHDQIAQDLGVTRSTVTKRIAYGIERVRERLRKGGVLLTTAALTALASERMAEAAPVALKAALGRLALSGVAQSAAVGATGMTLLTKVLAAAVLVITASVGVAVAYHRPDTPPPAAALQHPVAAAPKAVAPQTKQTPHGIRPTSSPADVLAANAAPKTASLSGKVTDKDTSQGIPGAEVLLASDGGIHKAQTNERGEYRIDDVPPGVFYAACTVANGYHVGAENWDMPEQRLKDFRELKLERGASLTGIDFALSRGEGITGIAVDANGKPLAGAKVTASATINNYPLVNTAESRADGTFFVSGFPPTVGLYAWADKGNLVSATAGPYALPQEDRTVDPIVLQPEAILCGIISDKQGKPLPEYKVFPQFLPAEIRRVAKAESGPDGRFELKGLPTGSIALRVCRDEIVKSHLPTLIMDPGQIVNAPCPTVSLAAGQVLDGLTLTCSVGSLAISGQVLDAQGKGVANAWVNCVGAEPSHESHTTTGEDGKFVLAALEAGTYKLTATRAKYLPSAPVEVPAGSDNVQLVMPNSFAVEGRVVDAISGKPLSEYEIKYCRFPQDTVFDSEYEKTNNPDGSFKLDVAKSGEVRIAARLEGYLVGYTDISLDGTRATVGNVTVQLQPQADLRGSVHDATGAPIAGALVFSGTPYNWLDESHAAARSGDDGKFILPAKKLADETITVYHPNFPKAEVTLEQKHYAGQPIDAVLLPGARLACTVLSNGAPFPDAWVAIPRTQAGRNEGAKTGTDGKCLLHTTLSGECRVQIELPGAPGEDNEANQYRDVVLVPGQTTELTVDFDRGDASVSGEVIAPPRGMCIALTVTNARGTQVYYNLSSKDEEPRPSYAFTNLPEGEAVMNVSWNPLGTKAQAFLARRYTFTLTPGATVRQDIRLDGAASLWGTVGPFYPTERGNLIVLYGKIALQDTHAYDFDTDFCAHIPLAEDGTFSMEGFQPGAYTLVATARTSPDARPGQGREVSAVVDLTPQGQEVNLELPR